MVARTSRRVRSRKGTRIVRKGASRRRKAIKNKGNLKKKTSVALGRGFPYKVTDTLIYAENSDSFTAIYLNTAHQYWRANSLYDPDVTATGHQPTPFDQFMLVYQKWMVIGAKIEVEVIPAFSTTVQSYQPPVVALYLDDATSLVTDYNAVGQNGGTVKFINIAQPMKIKFTKKFSARKTEPGRKGMLHDEDYVGTNSTNPSKQWYFHLVAYNLDTTAGHSLTFYYRAKISYITVFWDPIYLGVS